VGGVVGIPGNILLALGEGGNKVVVGIGVVVPDGGGGHDLGLVVGNVNVVLLKELLEDGNGLAAGLNLDDRAEELLEPAAQVLKRRRKKRKKKEKKKSAEKEI